MKGGAQGYWYFVGILLMYEFGYKMQSPVTVVTLVALSLEQDSIVQVLSDLVRLANGK